MFFLVVVASCGRSSSIQTSLWMKLFNSLCMTFTQYTSNVNVMSNRWNEILGVSDHTHDGFLWWYLMDELVVVMSLFLQLLEEGVWSINILCVCHHLIIFVIIFIFFGLISLAAIFFIDSLNGSSLTLLRFLFAHWKSLVSSNSTLYIYSTKFVAWLNTLYALNSNE
jgi:hypothetical protein